jgi:ubiquitin conjugation factor E4 B
MTKCQLICAQIRDELDYLPVLVSLPPQQTVFEYLVGCWKRLNSARSAVMKKVTDNSLVPLMPLLILISI